MTTQKKKMAKAATFGAASLAASIVVTGTERPAKATCDGAALIPSLVTVTEWLSSYDGGAVGDPLEGDSSGDYYFTIPSNTMYGLQSDETGVLAKLYYYPSGNELKMRGCRVGTTSTSFTCTSTASKTASASTTTITGLEVNLDSIAATTNSGADFYVLDAWGPNGYPHYTGAAFERGIRYKLGKNADWESTLGAAIDMCACW